MGLFFYTKKGSIISTVDLPTTEIIEPIFEAFGKYRFLEVSHPEVQAQVANLRAYITEHFYTCTKEILQNLGFMYVEDERFSANIDRAGGPGTVAFVSQAIAIFAKNK
jgi:hypothetical protein